MTTKKKAGTPKKRSKKLNLKKETLKDLEPSSGKDARGGYDGGCSIRPPFTWTCPPTPTKYPCKQ